MRLFAVILTIVFYFAPFANVQRSAWAITPGVTSIEFEQSVLHNLGIEVETAGTASPQLPGQTGFAVVNPATLSYVAPGGDFEGFSGGELQHTGDLLLRIGERAFVLSNFVLRVAANPLELELLDATGQRRLRFEFPQPYVRDGELHLRNVDVTVAADLAEELGRPELAGAYLGRAHVRLPASNVALATGPAGADPCGDVFTADRDVALISLGTVSQLDREAGGRVSLTLAATLRNVGTSAILWRRAIEPDGLPDVVGEHPYLALHVYRITDGRIKQIGRSDVKHAFFTTNSMCTCTGGHVIYSGCEDVYSAVTNADRNHLGPRDEVNSASGNWTRLGSHFDGTPADDFRDHTSVEHDGFEHRLIVHEAELQQGGEFFIEGWYIIRDDVDLFNSMGHYPISPNLSGVWTFGPESPIEQGSILDRLVDPAAPPPGSRSLLIDTGEGRLQFAIVTTDLGGGQFHHEYALMNFDFDRQVRALGIELQPGVSVSNFEFVDVDRDAGNDWPVTSSGSLLSWSAPDDNQMDWGTLYSFAFDADAEDVELNMTLHAAECVGGGRFSVTDPELVCASEADDEEDSDNGLAVGMPLAILLLGLVVIYRRARLF